MHDISINIIFLLHFSASKWHIFLFSSSSCHSSWLPQRRGFLVSTLYTIYADTVSLIVLFWLLLRYCLTLIIYSIILLTDDLLWYVLHGITVYMDLGCAWYGVIVFKIWYLVIRITWYHRIHGFRMCMIRYHRIEIRYVVIRMHGISVLRDDLLLYVLHGITA